MTVEVVEHGVRRPVPIHEGEIFLLPGRIPHSPQVRAGQTLPACQQASTCSGLAVLPLSSVCRDPQTPLAWCWSASERWMRLTAYAGACDSSLALPTCRSLVPLSSVRIRDVFHVHCAVRHIKDSSDVLYQEWFHCADLGTQLPPVMARFFASDDYKTGPPLPCHSIPGVGLRCLDGLSACARCVLAWRRCAHQADHPQRV